MGHGMRTLQYSTWLATTTVGQRRQPAPVNEIRFVIQIQCLSVITGRNWRGDLTSFLHEIEEFVEEGFASGIVIQLVQLQKKNRKKKTKLAITDGHVQSKQRYKNEPSYRLGGTKKKEKKGKKKRDVRGIRLAAKQIAGNYRNTTFFSTFHSLQGNLSRQDGR